jgi:uncharacterized protein
MIPSKATRVRKHPLILGLLVLLACVSAGARANAQGDNLINAADKGDLARVKALLSAKADVNAKRVDGGVTALMAASANGHLEVVRALLAANADVNAKQTGGGTALMLASANGHLEVVQALLAAKADVNAKQDIGATALMIASVKGNLETHPGTRVFGRKISVT